MIDLIFFIFILTLIALCALAIKKRLNTSSLIVIFLYKFGIKFGNILDSTKALLQLIVILSGSREFTGVQDYTQRSFPLPWFVLFTTYGAIEMQPCVGRTRH